VNESLVVAAPAARERAAFRLSGRPALSLLFVVSYLGLGVPAVAVGFLAVHGPGLIGAARYYGAALILLAALAMLALARAERKERNRS
jgi:hypothetical protein